MKELKVISLENGVILSENLVKGSILPRTSAELERDVLIQNDTIVEGAVYARKLEIQNGDVEILGAVFTKLEFHISNNAKGDIILRKTVATSDSLVSYARDCRPMFMADINGKTVKLCNAFSEISSFVFGCSGFTKGAAFSIPLWKSSNPSATWGPTLTSFFTLGESGMAATI